MGEFWKGEKVPYGSLLILAPPSCRDRISPHAEGFNPGDTSL